LPKYKTKIENYLNPKKYQFRWFSMAFAVMAMPCKERISSKKRLISEFIVIF